MVRVLRAMFAVVLLAAMTLVLNPSSANAATSVTVGGATRALDGTNVYRSTNFLVLYTPAKGATTGANQYGFEAAVVNNVVTTIQNGVGNMAIPSNGFVLSGHGTSRTWLQQHATVGAAVALDGGGGGGGGGTALLPDLGIRTLRQFTIANVGGVKELKFPAVTANVGAGPFEIHGTRPSSTSTTWTGTQTVYNSDGSKTTTTRPGVNFEYAGDGHNHWHVMDVDSYELFNASGTRLRVGEKHGFCFEDNTSYRNWPGNPAHPASPANPVYNPSRVCGVNQPTATAVEHGLSVGWGDTYPSTLPNQYIDITGLANGTYRVVVTADGPNFFQESNNSNNAASAQISISGNTVTLISATDGL
jgi:hypothetical protein